MAMQDSNPCRGAIVPDPCTLKELHSTEVLAAGANLHAGSHKARSSPWPGVWT